MFEGKRGEVSSSSSEFKRGLKSIIIVVMTITFLSIVYYIVLSYYIGALGITGNENFQESSSSSANPIRVSNQNSVFAIRNRLYFDSITMSALQKKSLSACESDQLNLDEQYACKIITASQLNDSSYCTIKFDSTTKVPLVINPPERTLISFQDFCWFRLSIIQRSNYCSLIRDEKGREFCLMKINASGNSLNE